MSESSNTPPEQKPTQQQQAGMDSTISNVVSFLTNTSGTPRQSIVYRFLMMVAAVVLIGYGVSAASKIIGPMFLALFLAIILQVPLQWMQKKGCPKIIALIIVIVSTVIIFVGISYHVAKSLNYLVAKSPEYKANLEAKIATIDKRLEQIGIAITGLTAWQNKNNDENEDDNNNENIDNNTIDQTIPELLIDGNNDALDRINNPDTIILPQNNILHQEAPSNNVDPNNIDIGDIMPDQNTIITPTKPATQDLAVIDKSADFVDGSAGVLHNRNDNSESSGNEVNNDLDKNSADDATDKVKETVEDNTSKNADENVGNNSGNIDEDSNIETTSLSEFLGGSRVGFGFLKDDLDKTRKESQIRPKRNSQSEEKSQLILLNSQDVMVWLRTSLIAIREIGESAFLVLIFTIFMVFEAASFPKKVDRAFGFDGPINNQRLQEIAGEIRRYLFLKAISSMMSAVAATTVYWCFGVPAMFFWGVVAFFLYFIPNVGGILASIIPGLLIFMTHDWQGVAVYAVCLVCIECTIGYGIEPKMLGHGLGISTVVILLSLFTWGMLLGPIGLFMAAPLTIMVKITLQASKETEWIATLIDRK